MKKREILRRGRLMRARIHIGANGVSERIMRLFAEAFQGVCIDPTPSPIIKVKVHNTCPISAAEVIRRLELRSPARCAGTIGDCLIFVLKSPQM